ASCRFAVSALVVFLALLTKMCVKIPASLHICPYVKVDALMAKQLLVFHQQPTRNLLRAPFQAQLVVNNGFHEKRHFGGLGSRPSPFYGFFMRLLMTISSIPRVPCQLSTDG